MTTEQLLSATLSQLSTLLANKELSSVELTKTFLAHIPKANKATNALIQSDADFALSQARSADERRAQGENTPLLGIPFIHKDIFCVQGMTTTCGSKMLQNFVPPYNATVTQKLFDAGMVMLGKANMDEFAMGSSNETSYYGPVKNPWDTKLVPGGSSGGSATAVSVGMAPIATGSDTGGSIRQPAALTGITGIKPTYGRISRYGMIAFASSFDQAGIFAKTAQDSALVLQQLCGGDSKDVTCAALEQPDFTTELQTPLNGLKVGVLTNFQMQELPESVHNGMAESIATLSALGADIQECTLKSLPLAMSAYYVLSTAECSSNLARYDGVRYGYRAENTTNLEDLISRSRAEGFGSEVKRRIALGTFVLSSGYFDAYYIHACKSRRIIAEDFDKLFQQYDILISPTTSNVAFGINEKTRDPVEMYRSDLMTNPINLAGVPAMSIPMPADSKTGLPLGLQLIGKKFDEATLLRTAHQIQQVTQWHTHLPPLHSSRNT